MARITPTTLAGGYASIADLNANFVALAAEFEKCMYLDAEVTNTWSADMDANSQVILNLADGVNAADSVNLSQVQALIAAITVPVDHGLLTGLTDDDHSQYLLATGAGNRTFFASSWSTLTAGATSDADALHDHAQFKTQAEIEVIAQGVVGSGSITHPQVLARISMRM